MVRLTKEEADAILRRNDALSQRKCMDCGAPTPSDKHRLCLECAEKRRHGEPIGKQVQVDGMKVNKCRYCGQRADSKDGRRTYTDEQEVKWFRCPCSTQEAQLYYIAKVVE